MDWSPQQEAALKDVDRWLKNPSDKIFRLFGYAGTGKTTLAKHLAQGVKGNVLFGAYTGKAAHVLKSKGCTNAQTIHSMIYVTKEKGKKNLQELEIALITLIGELRERNLRDEEIEENLKVKEFKAKIKAEKDSLAKPLFYLNDESVVRSASLVIIDECSMVDGRMGEDLLSFGKKVLVLGDPAQLPPIGGGGFFTEHKPNVMLTDIHRQAKDNPIIELATLARNKQSLNLGNYGSSSVISPKDMNQDFALSADQILVGRNKTRQASNRRLRELKGITEALPVEGDKLVCLRNNQEKGLYNGAIWNVENVGMKTEDRVYMTLNSDTDQTELLVEAHAHHFQNRSDELAWWEKKEADEFDYGYALTVHKSQGSQWNNVLLFNESSAFKQDSWRWLYTGITRAAESIKIVS